MQKNTALNFNDVHPSWLNLLKGACQKLEPEFYHFLMTDNIWLPGPQKIFNAFNQSIENTQYILFGESPYPRAESANGYAFWDAAVTNLWSETGLAKAVNRATSLRNLLKMLLVTRGDLSIDNLSQTAIAKLNKAAYVQTVDHLFNNLQAKGFLLLNMSLCLSSRPVRQDALAWQPFIRYIVEKLLQIKPDVTLILFGKYAQKIEKIIHNQNIKYFTAEHPYNISFIHNQVVQAFFKPFDLLSNKIVTENLML